MKIAVGSDHRGFQVKSKLVELLKQMGHDVTDEKNIRTIGPGGGGRGHRRSDRSCQATTTANSGAGGAGPAVVSSPTTIQS